jgi:hypothetical protein
MTCVQDHIAHHWILLNCGVGSVIVLRVVTRDNWRRLTLHKSRFLAFAMVWMINSRVLGLLPGMFCLLADVSEHLLVPSSGSIRILGLCGGEWLSSRADLFSRPHFFPVKPSPPHHPSVLIEPEDGTNRYSEKSANKHNTPSKNPRKTRINLTLHYIL